MDLFKYRIWCNTESAWITVWAPETPTVCPNNNTHSIDTDKIIVVSKKLDKGPVDRSGKTRVHQTSRALGTKTYFTGAGDNPDNPVDVGGGIDFNIKHEIGVDSTAQILFLDFNMIENETWIHEGYIIWKDTNLDKVTLEVIPKITSYYIDSTAQTNYELYGGYLIVPPQTVGKASGAGTLIVTTDLTDGTGGLVFMPDDDLGNPPQAFWNADWDVITKKFKNITPAPAGNGRYNLFTIEVVLSRFVNRISLLGNGFEKLQTSDCDQIGHGMRFKFIASTSLPDHNWNASFLLVLHRDKTV